MPYDAQTLRGIYDRTSGYCHICTKKLSFTNYARPGRKGAWEVEHSVPRAKGGTDHGNNLFAAHITCNREKSDFTTRTARSWHGNTHAPLSKERREQVRAKNALAGGVIGGAAGAVVGGPIGALVGMVLGAAFGHSTNPEKR